MRTASFNIHPILWIFLPRNLRQDQVILSFNPGQTVKHLIESIGIPHTEVSLFLFEENSIPFEYQVNDADSITVLPQQIVEELEDHKQHRFIIDNHLGRLTAHLRMLGFDCLYRNDYDDDQLAQISSQQQRILLTRDRRLLMRKIIIQGCWVHSKDPLEQTTEVIRRYNLLDQLMPFARCMRCNDLLHPISKDQIMERLLPLTRKFFTEFSQCPSCKQVYWKGSHHERMQQMIQYLVTQEQKTAGWTAVTGPSGKE